MLANTRVSDLISSQLPQFIRDDHETFQAFLESYYEYLEQSGELSDVGNNLIEYFDIDKTLTSFADHMYNEFMLSIPRDISADKAIVLKHIKDFYRAKGSEKSLKFLMRVLYGLEATIYYPKKDILRTDHGTWYVQKSLRVSNVAVDGTSNTNLTGLSLFINKRVYGQTSNASATIERVDRFYEYGQQINEIVLSNITGTFDSGEELWCYVNEDNVTNVTANVLSSGILNLRIYDGGSGYHIGDPLTFESNTGTGAAAYVSAVAEGNVSNITIVYSGAGFLANDPILVTGDGVGAEASVVTIDDGEQYHPNTYTIYTTTFDKLANTSIDAADYANLSHDIITSPNANSRIIDTLTSFQYGPCGPLQSVHVDSGGSGYTGVPSFSVFANTNVTEMGILGRIEIYDGGTGYSNSDFIEFFNVPNGAGTGASANVVVDGDGVIMHAYFVEQPGFPIGGLGYSQQYLPTCNIATSTGTGANIAVTAIIGDGESLTGGTGGLGSITSILLTNRGSGYTESPTINLSAYGDGSAVVTANVISGVFAYEGRYLNDNGFLDSYNFLANRDYYQEFSYEIEVQKSLNKYRKAVINLIHPAGVKLFGKYVKDSVLYENVEFVLTDVSDDEIISTPLTALYDRGELLLYDREGSIIEVRS